MTDTKPETMGNNTQANNAVVLDVLTLIDAWSSDHDRQWREYALELMSEIEKELIK